MAKIIGIGETVLDIVFKNNQPQAAVPGGSTFNAMISLGRTTRKAFENLPIYMVTEVGDDHVGDIVMDFMKANGVRDDAVTVHENSQTHVSMAFLNEKNDAQYEFYKDHANAILSVDKVNAVGFEKGDVVLFGSFFAINPKIREYVSALIHAAHDAGAIIYYDINFRKSHLKDLPLTFGFIEENIRLSDVVKGSHEDFGLLYGTSDPEEVYAKHISKLCPNFICTCGSGPVHVFMPGFHETYPVAKIETVSTIGAGDNFNAGFVYGLIAEQISKDENRSLFSRGGKMTADIVEKMVSRACRFSANVCRSLYNYVDEDFVA